MDEGEESELKTRAESGDPDARLDLARALWRTESPGKQAEAIRWFEAAVTSGGAEHKRVYGALLCWEPGPFQDFSRGFELLRQAAEMGDPTAQYSVAAELAVGDNVPRDPRAAAHWYTRAAEAGSAEAAYNLAVMHLEGDGVPIDRALAVSLLERAASKGELLALRALAEGYETGANGLPVDLPKAADWRARYEAARRSTSG